MLLLYISSNDFLNTINKNWIVHKNRCYNKPNLALINSILDMNTDDLDKFIVIAATENMQRAAEILDCHASMLSKVLKRLEYHFDAPLFDRIGKHIRLNNAGKTLQNKAAQIAADLKQTKADIAKQTVNISYHVVGPAMILRRWASVINTVTRQDSPQVSLQFTHLYEAQSLEKVINGLADIAFVTGAIVQQVPNHLHCQPVGLFTMKLAASPTHPLLAKSVLFTSKNLKNNQNQTHQPLRYPMGDILAHAFVVPERSPYCGKTDTLSCDGWNDSIYPRLQQIVSNDDELTSRLIHSGQALAYLSDDWINTQGFIAIAAKDAITTHEEDIFMISRNPTLIEKCIQSNQT